MTNKVFLSKEEEIKLGEDIVAWRNDKNNLEKKIKAEYAIAELFQANDLFAINLARKFISKTNTKTYDLEDAIADARIGLLKTILRYDPTRNSKITTASSMPIYKELFISCNKNNMLIHFRDYANVDYAKAKKDWLDSNLADDMTLKEFVVTHQENYKSLTDENFDAVESVVSGISSFDFLVSDGTGQNVHLGDLIEDKQASDFHKHYEDNNIKNILTAFGEDLTPLQKNILEYNFDDNARISKETFFNAHGINQRRFTLELNKALKILKHNKEMQSYYLN